MLTSLARGSAHLKQLCVESYTLLGDLSAMLCLLADDAARDEWSMSASSAQVRTSRVRRDNHNLKNKEVLLRLFFHQHPAFTIAPTLPLPPPIPCHDYLL